MTKEEINKIIAQHCGWYVIQPPEEIGANYSIRDPHSTIRYPWHEYEQHAWEDAPDYCNDLNSMHEAEKTLEPRQVDDYLFWLTEIKGKQTGPGYHPPRDIVFECWVHATSHQRAEAFVRTIGKWKE